MVLKIARPTLDAALYKFCHGGHGLLIGHAGAGKSHSLLDLAEALKKEGRRYLYISVDDLGSAEAKDTRAALGYPQEDFSDAIDELYASAPEGTVIFDGFDAAREDNVRGRVLQMIRASLRRAPPGWTVLASVREYDARKSPTLTGLFSQTTSNEDPAFQDSGIEARHLVIPNLTDDELRSAFDHFPALAAIHEKANENFRRLMRTPFNLWLLTRILTAHRDAEKRLSSLQSEVQLLSAFWSSYVTNTPDSHSRIRIARMAVERMLAAHTLSISKHFLSKAESTESLDQLLSAGILVESGTAKQSIRFFHNILFDFATSILALESTTDIIALLSEHPSRPFFLRPGLHFLLAQCWHDDRDRFWTLFWALVSSDLVTVRVVGRLLAPLIVANEASSIADLDPLVLRNRENNPAGRNAILRTLQALRLGTVSKSRAAWAHFATRISREPSTTFAWELASHIERLIPDANEEALAFLGEAARNLFEWAWQIHESWHQAFAASAILPLVLRTFDSNRADSESIICRVLSLLDRSDFPLGFVATLAREIESVFNTAPDLAADAYRRVFAHEESSTAKTSMGGPLLSLTSNRRQDFDMCKYALANSFPKFLKAHPAIAIAAGLSIMNGFSSKKRGVGAEEGSTQQQTFLFRGKPCHFTEDWSVSWTSVVSRDEEGLIQNALENFLPRCELPPELIADLAAHHAHYAWSWSLFLETGIRAPSRYAEAFFDLALARPLQTGIDTKHLVAGFVEAAWSFWSKSNIDRFQTSVLQFDDGATENSDRKLSHLTELLLSRLPIKALTIPEAQKVVKALTEKKQIPKNEPAVKISGWTAKSVSDRERLLESGEDFSSPERTASFDAATELKTFADTWANKAPPPDEVERFYPRLKEAFDSWGQQLLPKSDPYPAGKEGLSEYFWTQLAAVAHAFSRSAIDRAGRSFQLAKATLVRAATFPLDSRLPRSERDFTPSWPYNPRTEAIQGLAVQADKTPDDREPVESFVSFSDSPDPSERFLVAWLLIALRRYWPNDFWKVAAQRATEEASPAILATLVRTILNGPESEGDPRAEILKNLVSQSAADQSRVLQEAISEALTSMSLVRGYDWASDRIAELFSAFPQNASLSSKILADIVSVIGDATSSGQKAIAKSAVNCLLLRVSTLVTRSASSMVTLRELGSDNAALDTLKAAHQLVAEIAQRLYFGSLRRTTNPTNDSPEAETAFLREYCDAVWPIMRALLSFADPSSAGTLSAAAAHSLIQLAKVALPFRPEEALNLAARTVLAASSSGYHIDSTAAGEVVSLVEIVMTDYRDRLRESFLDDLVSILDVFADAGWPEALRLVWRLDEAFR